MTRCVPCVEKRLRRLLAEERDKVKKLEADYHAERIRSDQLFDALEAERDYNKTNEEAFRKLSEDLEEANELIDSYRLMEIEWRRIDGERRLLDANVSTRCQ